MEKCHAIQGAAVRLCRRGHRAHRRRHRQRDRIRKHADSLAPMYLIENLLLVLIARPGFLDHIDLLARHGGEATDAAQRAARLPRLAVEGPIETRAIMCRVSRAERTNKAVSGLAHAFFDASATRPQQCAECAALQARSAGSAVTPSLLPLASSVTPGVTPTTRAPAKSAALLCNLLNLF
jgi:hypothetical protein